MKKLRILISNDDGIHAPGILALARIAQAFGEITVVAPDSPQSAMGHAISIGRPLRVEKEILFDNVVGYACNGTPADCVKLATGAIMDDVPHLVLSGINHGSNSSVSTIYSGTLSAAREGAIQGIPAIGFSLCNFSHEADLRTAAGVAEQVISQALEHRLQPGQCLNVNVPNVLPEQLQGIRITRQAMGRWVEEFDKRVDPFGKPYYWLTGQFELLDEGTDTDEWAIRNHYAAVTPIHHDLTDHGSQAELRKWNFNPVRSSEQPH